MGKINLFLELFALLGVALIIFFRSFEMDWINAVLLLGVIFSIYRIVKIASNKNNAA
jgi:hypothetical protein